MAEKNKFEEYLLSEYSNIAQAHFKSIETISTFFRYYLLIMSIPISAIAIFSQIVKDETQIIDLILKQHKVPVSIVLICISMIGFGILWYVINLRLDTILYARAVNSMRKYFYDESNVDINIKLQMRVLPQSPKLPHYFETFFFLPVVIVFAIMNNLYLLLFLYILKSCLIYYLLSPLFLLLHVGTYWFLASYRETVYLKSNILGIDIDGVLNKHRDKFCSLLYEKTGKKIGPDKITIIPVREHPTMGITLDDERKVFNDPRYWTDMDIIEDAMQTVEILHDNLGLKIYIFTYRPWPHSDNKNELSVKKRAFLDSCTFFPLKYRILKWVVKFKIDPLHQITKEWLKKHKLSYDKLIFEKIRDKSNNRLYVSRIRKIRFFVEDDLEKAIKLSYICDIVFLFSQPYNQKRIVIPSNIIRVESWNDIYKQIRKFI